MILFWSLFSTIANSLLVFFNIFIIYCQYKPKLICYICSVYDTRETYLVISNNSLYGVYIDEIDYSNELLPNHKSGNPKLNNYRLLGNSDYCIKLVESCSVTIKFKRRCKINEYYYRKEVVLSEPLATDKTTIYRSKASLSTYIFLN